MSDLVLYVVRARTAILTLSRPDRANTITAELVEALQAAVETAVADPEVRVIVVTGAGRHFCGGADLREAGPDALDRLLRHPRGIGLDWAPKPVIAAINGAAMGGGCEIALSCDFRLMAETAKIGLTEIRFGALPAGGGCIRAPRLIGAQAARRMIMLGEPLSAQEAQRIGLVDEICPADALMERVFALADILASRAPYAMRTAKQLLAISQETDLATGLALERALIGRMATPEEMQAARDEAATASATYAKIFSGGSEN